MARAFTQDKGSFRAAVIIPVFNALSQTERCLRSVLKYRGENVLVVVVNDRSDQLTTEYLKSIKGEDNFVLIENDENVGFCRSVNRGLDRAKGEAEFVVLLNSDTVVSEGWIDSFEQCFQSDAKIGLATALSNNADNLSIAMPAGMNYQSVARFFSNRRVTEYPDITTAIGFCLGIRSSILNTVGLLDESFGKGYGEDSDYHYKVVSAGYRSVALPDCYVYHDSHASFGNTRAEQISQNAPVFDQRWKTIHEQDSADADERKPLKSLASALETEALRARQHDVLFVLPSWVLAGGIVVVYELVNRLIQRGIDANCVIVAEKQPIEMDLLFTPYFLSHEQWRGDIPRSRLYVATRWDTVPYVALARMRYIESQLVYLIQGYEGWFSGSHLSDVVSTYRAIPHRITVSGWLSSMLDRWDVKAECIPNGIDTLFFSPPADREQRARHTKNPVVLTMLRDDPQGGWRISIEVLQRLKKEFPGVSIIAVGDLVHHPEIAGYLDERYERASRREMRELYRKADIFLECSVVQGFGLMGLEAMSTGACVVVSATGGTREYANDTNAMLHQIGDAESALQALRKLVSQPALRERLGREGRKTAEKFDLESCVDRYADYFRSVMNAHPAFDLYAVCEMLLSLFQHAKGRQISQNIGSELLRREFQGPGGPREADEVFRANERDDVFEVLRASHDGQLLLRLYEAGRSAYTSALSDRPLSESSQSLLERVIKVMQ